MGLLKRYAPVVSTSLLLAGAWLWDAIVTHSTANCRPECAYEDVTVQLSSREELGTLQPARRAAGHVS
jgi:hypothetical protein